MTETPRAALVTGATGVIGRSLVNALLARGTRVRILARRQVPAGFFMEPVEIVCGEITDPKAVTLAMEGTGEVFHLAAKLHIPTPAAELESEYEVVNELGTQTVAEAALEAGAERLVFFSTVSVYGSTGIDPVDETTTPKPDTVYARTKLRAEEMALANGRAVVLRMAAVYGHHMKGNYVSLARAIKHGRFIPIGSGSNLRTLIYSADAVRAALLAASHPNATGRIYNVSDGSLHSVAEITAAICEALGRGIPRVAVPAGVVCLGARFVDAAIAASGRQARFGPAVDKYLETVAVKAERIQCELGFRPEYDLRRGWAETLRGWRDTPDT